MKPYCLYYYPIIQVGKLASQAFFCYSDEPRFEFPTNLTTTLAESTNRPGEPIAQSPFQQSPQTNVNQISSPPGLDGSYLSLDRRSKPAEVVQTMPNGNSIQPVQSTATDGVPVMKFSLKHDGMYLYLSRILR